MILLILNPSLSLYCCEQARPIFKDPSSFPRLVDPRLEGNYSAQGLKEAVGMAIMCLEEEPTLRPLISDVVSALCSTTYTNPPY